jgi:uncharacterized protein (TIGR02996 family)
LTHQSFLSLVLKDPGADELRLRYADWLDQSCDPRGEFIRVQCRLARPAASEKHLHALELRERELLAEFEPAWTEPIAGMVDGWAFHRGFVHEVMTTAEKFLEHAEQLFSLAPIREVHFNDAAGRLAGLAACSALGRVDFVDLSDNRLGDIGLKLLAHSVCLRGVRGLNLSVSAAGNAGAQALACCPHLKNLEELYLSANKIGHDGAHALAHSPYLQALKTLFLNGNCIGQVGSEALRQRFGARVHL